MINFFRKQRKKIADDNKTLKYARYAIGEIFLVVIGILIALQINTWNENRKLAKQETSYLKRLLSENKQDLSIFSNNIKGLEKGIETVIKLSEELKKSQINDSILVQVTNNFFNYGSIYPIFTSSTSTFEDLSSTGNLQIITNTKLRESIVQHYTKHKQVEERNLIAVNWALPLDAPFSYNHAIMRFEPNTSFLFPEQSTGFLASEIKENKTDFINNIAVHYWINMDAIDQLKILIEETKTLIEKLESELKRKPVS